MVLWRYFGKILGKWGRWQEYFTLSTPVFVHLYKGGSYENFAVGLFWGDPGAPWCKQQPLASCWCADWWCSIRNKHATLCGTSAASGVTYSHLLQPLSSQSLRTFWFLAFGAPQHDVLSHDGNTSTTVWLISKVIGLKLKLVKYFTDDWTIIRQNHILLLPPPAAKVMWAPLLVCFFISVCFCAKHKCKNVRVESAAINKHILIVF